MTYYVKKNLFSIKGKEKTAKGSVLNYSPTDFASHKTKWKATLGKMQYWLKIFHSFLYPLSMPGKSSIPLTNIGEFLIFDLVFCAMNYFLISENLDKVMHRSLAWVYNKTNKINKLKIISNGYRDVSFRIEGRGGKGGGGKEGGGRGEIPVNPAKQST